MGSLQDGNRWVVSPEGASCGGSRGILPRRFYALVPIPKGAGRSAGGAVGSHRPLFGLGPWVGAPVAPQQSRILRPVLPQLCDRVRGRGPFRSLFIHRGERERSRSGQPERCHPAGVRRSRPARSSDSNASPKRSFFTPSASRSLARVSTTPVSRSSTWSWSGRCCWS